MSQKLNIANFICKFGERLVLLDMLDEVVLPAFTKPLTRTYGEDVKYFFHGVQILDVSDGEQPEIAIAGRIVKETTISRDQVYAGGRIIKDRKELESAPSSFFVLLLSNHKLLYVRETAGAPALSTFETTVNVFLKTCYREWLKAEVKGRSKDGISITQKALIEEVPIPNVEIVELSTNAEIHSFVKKFKVINTVEIQLLNTNHETDNAPLFRNLRRVKGKLGADQLTIKNTRSGDVGLNKGDVADFVAGQAEEANARIVIRGKDLEGEAMNAVNDHFKLSISLPDLSTSVVRATHSVVEVFRRQLRNGSLSVKRAPVAALRTISQLRSRLR